MAIKKSIINEVTRESEKVLSGAKKAFGKSRSITKWASTSTNKKQKPSLRSALIQIFFLLEDHE